MSDSPPIVFTACSEGDELPVFEVLCEALQGNGSLDQRVEELNPPKRICPKGHVNKCLEIGCGKFFCHFCGVTFTS